MIDNSKIESILRKRQKSVPTLMLQASIEEALSRYFAQLESEGASDHYDLIIREIEPPLIKAALIHTGFNRSQAAKQLGFSRTTLHEKLNQYELVDWIQEMQRQNQAAAILKNQVSDKLTEKIVEESEKK